MAANSKEPHLRGLLCYSIIFKPLLPVVFLLSLLVDTESYYIHDIRYRTKRDTSTTVLGYSECNFHLNICVCSGCWTNEHNDSSTNVCCKDYLKENHQKNTIIMTIAEWTVDKFTETFEESFKQVLIEHIKTFCEVDKESCEEADMLNVIASDIFISELKPKSNISSDLDVYFVLFIDKLQHSRRKRSVYFIRDDLHTRRRRSTDYFTKDTMPGISMERAIQSHSEEIKEKLSINFTIRLFDNEVIYTHEEYDRSGWGGMTMTSQNGLIFLTCLSSFIFLLCAISAKKAVR